MNFVGFVGTTGNFTILKLAGKSMRKVMDLVRTQLASTNSPVLFSYSDSSVAIDGKTKKVTNPMMRRLPRRQRRRRGLRT
jgi:hypothetical protein